jgi:hypothetical protein
MKSPVQAGCIQQHGYCALHFWDHDGEEVAAMDKFVDELHNKEDASTFGNAILLFVAIFVGLSILGVIFWSAF